jgi:hypothetical protein
MDFRVGHITDSNILCLKFVTELRRKKFGILRMFLSDFRENVLRVAVAKYFNNITKTGAKFVRPIRPET